MARFDPRGKANRALLVGVPDYDFTRPEHPFGVAGDLRAVEHNLTGLERALRAGGVFAEDTITVTRPRTVDEFDQHLDAAVDAAQGLLLLYFSGHGAVPSTGDELWMLMRRATIVPGTESVFRGAVPWKSVLTVLSRARAERVVVILDCCYAGNASAAWDALGTAQRQRTSLLMSVQANNRIDAGDGDGPTPFTAQLVRLLRDGEAGSDELADRLRAHMSAHHTTLREPPSRGSRRAARPPPEPTYCSPPSRPPDGRADGAAPAGPLLRAVRGRWQAASAAVGASARPLTGARPKTRWSPRARASPAAAGWRPPSACPW